MYVRISHWLTFWFEYKATLDWLGFLRIACTMELDSITPVSAQVEKKIKRLFLCFTAHDITLLEDVIFHQRGEQHYHPTLAYASQLYRVIGGRVADAEHTHYAARGLLPYTGHGPLLSHMVHSVGLF